MLLSEVKENMHCDVMFEGSVYRLKNCVLWLDEIECKFKYSLTLLDKNRNSTITVPMEKVEVIQYENNG